jgi:hypothetical protein
VVGVRRDWPLCECKAVAREAHFAFLETADDADRERVDYVALKRRVEDRLDRDLAVSEVKRHFTDHLVYEYTPLQPVVDNDPDYGRGERR